MGKLPYIPDKKMYAAVMGACSYIRQTGWFNKATNYYADKYNVDLDELQRYVRIAQSNGQKTSAKRKYHYFAVEYSKGNERNGNDFFNKREAMYVVKRGLTEYSVKNTMRKDEDPFGEYTLITFFGRIQVCDTKEDAESVVEKWKNEGC